MVKRKEGIRIMFVMVLGLFFVTAPRASGDVKSATVNLPRHPSPVTIQYEVHNGVAIFQGDIELGKESELNAPVRRGYAWSSKDRVGMISQPLAVKAGDDVLWPGGIVPYVIDSNVPSGLSSEIQGAVQDYNRTNIKLQQRNEENDYVRFVRDDNIKGAGQSPIGRQGGRQDIKLKSDAGTATVIHELGHAIGLWHEQARNDRDSFVEVLWDNIESGLKHNFDKHISDGIDVGPYDFESRMHYGRKAFGKRDPLSGETLETLRSLIPGENIQPSNQLSMIDIQGVNSIYRDVTCGRVPILYEHDGLQGTLVSLEWSSPNLGDQNMGDRGSSLCVPQGWEVTLYEDADYKGSFITITGPQVILDLKRDRPNGRDWGDKISSVRVSGVQANPIPLGCDTEPVVFEHDRYRGRRLSLSQNVSTLHQSSIDLGDKISSICVPDVSRTVGLYVFW